MPLRITGAADAALIDLPWSVPLSAWPEDQIAALPRGLSRHVVRFVRHGDAVLAVKETHTSPTRSSRCCANSNGWAPRASRLWRW